jgi:uncharacterized protein
MRNVPSRRYAVWLWLLLVLFAFRVVAQPATLVITSGGLPPFDAWHSRVAPYPLLLASQIAIVLLLVRAAWSFYAGNAMPSRRVGTWSLALGSLYFGGMALRLILALTVFSSRRWFASPVPIVFHLVLASFLIIYGHFHYAYGVSPAGAKQS